MYVANVLKRDVSLSFTEGVSRVRSVCLIGVIEGKRDNVNGNGFAVVPHR